ncbi:DUF4062 domain-containing protein [Paeniglutamicibacter sp.]|uniref:DUF4062 domain-containing protein n=1 Tax=Paeniglutamicibacter sp. TaxID=1934391 RepID=UPI003988A5F1
MAYTAHVLRVMIASPSDLPEARDAVQEAIYSWNQSHSRKNNVVLLPWRWETSSVPVVGGRPQALINAQGVDESDIVFALFGSRLGSPTGEAVSGTAEEIERAVGLGKPVHVYFSSAPLPSDVDVDQLVALRDFKKDMQSKSLLGEFSTPSELNYEVWKAIEHDLETLALGSPVAPKRNLGVDFVVQPQRTRELSSHDAKGKPRYTTRNWLDITNQGDQDAEQVVYEKVGDNSGMTLLAPEEPTVIHRGQTRKVNVFYSMSGSGAAVVRIGWVEDGQEKQKDFHVG